MKTLTNSRLFIACMLLNIICCLVLLSEGYTVLGLLVLIAGILFCAVFVFHLWRDKSKHEADIKDFLHSYSFYLKTNRKEWFDANTSLLVNQSIAMIVFRVILVFSIVSLSIYSLIFDYISYFPNDIIFDKLMFVTIILFAIMYLVCGFRFCAIPAFFTYLNIMAVYFIHLLYHNSISDILFHNILTYGLIAVSFTFLSSIAYDYSKKNVYYSNIEKYERDGEYRGVDLCLKFFAPLEGYETFMRADIRFEPVQDYIFDDYLKRVNKLAHCFNVVLAGYEKKSTDEKYSVYLYLPAKENASIQKFRWRLRSLTEKNNIEICWIENYDDPTWNKYHNMYPLDNELCEIISRKHIEMLFFDGTTFDREYELSFFVNFKNKTDPAEFEEVIKYFGFSLMYASFCDEDSFYEAEQYYIGEYRIRSFISVHRLEYLNSLLLREAQEFGAVYLGEWQVEYE